MKDHSHTTRRNFIKTASAAAVGSTLAIHSTFAKNKAVNSETLKVGLIGCGGRGTGAANQALTADDNVVLWAMGDIFEDRMKTSLTALEGEHSSEKFDLGDRKYVGFDAYKKVLDSGVDMVILTTPPSFRPDHLQAAVDAKKHIFCEKPMAVDIPGIKKVMDAAKQAKAQGTNLMGGFCWRYDLPKRAAFQEVLEGKIGDVVSIYNTYNAHYLWTKPRKPDMTEMEYKLRNWIYYNWLSGDHIAEQAVHSLDMMAWALGDVMPTHVMGTGGRQRRVEDIYGNVYDHFALTYEYENGARGFHFSRQQNDTTRAYHVEIIGTKGTCLVDCIRRKHEIHDRKGNVVWKYDGERNNMYQTEHDELFAAIRNGDVINDAYMSQSTMLAIWGRMAAYTGQQISYEEVMNSGAVMGPSIDEYAWELDWPSAPVAKPGVTAFE